MKITINEGKALASSVNGSVYKIISSLEGRRGFNKQGGFYFEASRHNIDLFKLAYPALEIENQDMAAKPILKPIESDLNFDVDQEPYSSKTAAYGHQTRAIDKLLPLKASALFAEQGTGKTKIAIDMAGMRYLAGQITGVLVITKKGVHEQWIDEQVPTHLGEAVPREGYAWEGKTIPEALLKPGKLCFFAINIDALRTAKGFDACKAFIDAHAGRIFILSDESQDIANALSARAKAARKLAEYCMFRLIMSGTPILKNLVNLWSQFLFVDPNIIGHKYMTTFRAQYCIMGGFENRQVIGSKNVEALYELLEPFTFRITKEEELDLPPKNYAKEIFELHPDQLKHYKSFKENYLTMLDNGEVTTIANAAVLITRLQQIACGYLPLGDDKFEKLPNPRMDALLNVIEQRPGKMIIWARFNRDIEDIMAKLGDKAVSYYGGTAKELEEVAVKRFLDANSGIDFFVSNPQKGGTGLNLQGDCRTAVYYSNNYRAVDRWQSEDRIHRIGTVGTVTYIDLVANKTVDNRILANLRSKKSLSDLMLDDIRTMLKE